MDKTDALAGIELQSKAAAITLLRQLRDEVRALGQHFDLIADEMEDLDFDNGLPSALFDLPELLEDLRGIEQRALKVELQVGAEKGERE